MAQLDYPDNGFKSTKLTGPGQDIGRQAGTSYNHSVESVEVRDEEGWVSKGGIISCQPDFVTPIPSQGVEVAQESRFLYVLLQEFVECDECGFVSLVDEAC